EEVSVALQRAAQRSRRLELGNDDAHRHARLATLAIGHVGDVLAAAEAALQEIVDEGRRLVVRKMREELALQATCQVGAGLWRRDVELRKMLLLLGHSASHPHGGPMIGEAALAKQGGRRGAGLWRMQLGGGGRGCSPELDSTRAPIAAARLPTSGACARPRSPSPIQRVILHGRSAEASCDLIASQLGAQLARTG